MGKKESKKDKKKREDAEAAARAAAEAKAAKGSDDEDGEEEEEDLMGDQSWAKTDDFSGALDDMFGDLLGDMAGMQADAEAAGIDINAKMGSMGEDAAAAGAEEAKKKEEAAAADAEEAEKQRLAKARAEKRKNMSKEDKMAKMKVKGLKKKADKMKADGTLADEARYEEGLKLMEDEEWFKAEQALNATFDPAEEERKRKEAEEAEATAKAEEEAAAAAEKAAAEQEEQERKAAEAKAEEEEAAAAAAEEEARIKAEEEAKAAEEEAAAAARAEQEQKAAAEEAAAAAAAEKAKQEEEAAAAKAKQEQPQRPAAIRPPDAVNDPTQFARGVGYAKVVGMRRRAMTGSMEEEDETSSSLSRMGSMVPSSPLLPEDLESLKPHQLKSELKQRGLDHSGNRAQLIARLREHAVEQPPSPSAFSAARRPSLEGLSSRSSSPVGPDGAIDYAHMSHFELKRLCRERGMSDDGTTPELIEWLAGAERETQEAEQMAVAAEEWGAAKIQAGFRGLTARREVSTIRKTREVEREALKEEATRIRNEIKRKQDAAAGMQRVQDERLAAAHAREAEEAEIAEELRKEAEAEARALMESRFQEKLAARAAEKMDAATMIQQRYRGLREKRHSDQTAAAIRIQAMHRGRLSRRVGAPGQYTVDSGWGRRFLAGLGPNGVRSSRAPRHDEGSRDYLRRLMLPRLGAAMRAAEAARPADPAAFVAAELRESSWALTGKEWEETATEAERYAAAERREVDGRSSTDYIAELRLLAGVDAAMVRVSKERPERPWEVLAEHIEQIAVRRQRAEAAAAAAGGGAAAGARNFCSACGARSDGGSAAFCGSCGAQLT
jgi:hypothetical protein